jgi:hypothetical protein
MAFKARYTLPVFGSLALLAGLTSCGQAPSTLIPDVEAYRLIRVMTVCPMVNFAPSIEGNPDLDCAEINKDGTVNRQWFKGKQEQTGSVLMPDGSVEKGKYIDNNKIEPVLVRNGTSDKEAADLMAWFKAKKFQTTSKEAGFYDKVMGVPWTLEIKDVSVLQQYANALAKEDGGAYKYDPKVFANVKQALGSNQGTQRNNSQYSNGNTGNQGSQRPNGNTGGRQGQARPNVQSNQQTQGGYNSLPLFGNKFPKMQVRLDGSRYYILKGNGAPANTNDYQIIYSNEWNGVIPPGYNATRYENGDQRIVILTRRSQ